MPSRSNSNKFDYGDKYRALGVSQDTYRTVPTMTQWCKRQDWFDNKLMFKGSANGSKGTIKKRLNLMSQIKTSCGTRMRSLRQTLSTFIDQIGNASPEDQSKWLCSKSISFRPSSEQVLEYEEQGFGIPQIFELVNKRSLGLGEALSLSAGAWQSLLSLHDEVLRGDIEYDLVVENSMDMDEDDDIDLQPGAVISNSHKENANPNTNNQIKKPNTNKRNCHVLNDVTRKADENASNWKQRQKSGRTHPFFKEKGNQKDQEFRIIQVDPSAKQLPVITSTTGNKYIYDELSPWYRYDMVLVRVLLLRLHGLKKLHKRVISQRDAIQNAFRNKSLGFGDMRVPASLEFKIATTIAEHLRLVVRVKSEAVVYTKNAALINADPFSADYEIGPWNNCYENYSRLPRSGEQIQVLKDQNNFKKCETVFFFRSDLFKMQKAMDPEKWNTLVSLWRKWNILQFMPSYLAAFFPGNESAAKEIGLVSEDIVDAASLLQKEEDDDDEKDDDGDLNII
eukprot:56986_1